MKLKILFAKYSFVILSAASILFAIYKSYFLRWLCDDAFISFVYARNFAEGAGLVFQSGEKVEGYSNFLWTILLSLGIKFSFSSLNTSVFFGILSFFGLLTYFSFQEKKKYPSLIFPIFTLHLSLFYHNWIFATSGLETMCFTFFLSVALREWEKDSKYASLLFAIASLLRPEGALFFGIHFLSRFHEIKSIVQFKQTLSNYLLLPLGVLVGMELLRIDYYGEILPNTFYAKANHPGYFSQGTSYLLYWFRVYPVYALIFTFALYLLGRNLFFRERKSFLSAAVLLYMAYVIYVGGDFMGMRFWIPVIPYLSWIVYTHVNEYLKLINFKNTKNRILQEQKKIPVYLFSFLFLISLILYMDPFGGKNAKESTWNGIGEERRFYGNKLTFDSGYDLNSLQGFRVAFFGAQAHFIYWMRPDYAWEAETGLTDKRLARKSTSTRGRVGHEKNASLLEMKERKLDLVLDDRFPSASLPYITYQWRDFSWKIMVLYFDPFKFSNLCKREYWDCSPLYKEIARRKMDTAKDIDFLQ
ncbi:hypothetical protein LPTSP3_g23810 [Leptospira kobayashii]|uniref:Glycosyltransferase RgtA/B/C/D-like domain-containing protein n=1 Tax=Leptospira kobayashii TaxID=1917830 RepID=A0ABM7UKL5_9LEPT|nr:hypothetical protein [Leptospira kobayashii]BDA79451.1 hypothetical protein LPTSP3_g23810 [Leptospira kobayashii]